MSKRSNTPTNAESLDAAVKKTKVDEEADKNDKQVKKPSIFDYIKLKDVAESAGGNSELKAILERKAEKGQRIRVQFKEGSVMDITVSTVHEFIEAIANIKRDTPYPVTPAWKEGDPLIGAYFDYYENKEGDWEVVDATDSDITMSPLFQECTDDDEIYNCSVIMKGEEVYKVFRFNVNTEKLCNRSTLLAIPLGLFCAEHSGRFDIFDLETQLQIASFKNEDILDVQGLYSDDEVADNNDDDEAE